ncbi:hypothetical protein YTPLAS18_34210 [Nitrospira sp.]|nr:hypothetical protein YTPLAS18_34210 [Nitrospira sp.]
MRKRALLIGINKYRVPGADLRGCVNDVRNMQRVLTRYYGFAAKDISILTDYKATKRAIEQGIRKLVARSKKDDILLLHYSGHGSNVPDDDGDEADHRDEILCPTDLDWKDPLRDDWIRKTLNKVKAGVRLTVIMDCCHSGTITRAIMPLDVRVRARYLPSPWDLVAVESGRDLRGKRSGGLRASSRATRARKDVVPANISELLVTGCRDTQTSADAYIAGTYNGALTYYLAETITEAEGKLTYRELHAKTVAKLRRKSFDQVPQLEGNQKSFDRQFLS